MEEKSNSRLLPLGSIVSLNDDKRKFIIAGRGVISTDKKLWDYALFEYPFGMISSFDCIFASHDLIDEVHFIGYEDEIGKDAADIIVSLKEGKLNKEEFLDRVDKLVAANRAQLEAS